MSEVQTVSSLNIKELLFSQTDSDLPINNSNHLHSSVDHQSYLFYSRSKPIVCITYMTVGVFFVSCIICRSYSSFFNCRVSFFNPQRNNIRVGGTTVFPDMVLEFLYCSFFASRHGNSGFFIRSHRGSYCNFWCLQIVFHRLRCMFQRFYPLLY